MLIVSPVVPMGESDLNMLAVYLNPRFASELLDLRQACLVAFGKPFFNEVRFHNRNAVFFCSSDVEGALRIRTLAPETGKSTGCLVDLDPLDEFVIVHQDDEDILESIWVMCDTEDGPDELHRYGGEVWAGVSWSELVLDADGVAWEAVDEETDDLCRSMVRVPWEFIEMAATRRPEA